MTGLPHENTVYGADAFTADRPPPFDTWPALYALRCFGGCCEPEIGDGSSVAIDRQAALAAGDFVAIWHLADGGFITPMVKRLVLGLAPWTRFPHWPSPLCEIEPALIVETLNPPRRFGVDLSTVFAVHRCIGVTPARPDLAIGTKVSPADIRLFDRPFRPARVRKARVAAGGARA